MVQILVRAYRKSMRSDGNRMMWKLGAYPVKLVGRPSTVRTQSQ